MALPSLALFAVFLLAPMETSADPVTILVNYGGLVGAFALLIIGRLHTSAEVTALNNHIESLTLQLADKDDTIKAKDSMLAAFTQVFTHRAIPAMREMGDVLEAIPTQETALAALLRESLAKTEALTSRLDAQGGHHDGS